MSAEIIQFGKTARQVPAVEVSERRSTEHIEKASVRFIVADKQIEVDFHNNAVQGVYAIEYRVSADGVKEMRRVRWKKGYQDWDFDPAIERAARRALRREADKIDVAPFYKVSLAPLLKKCEKLVEMLQKVEATIVSMQQHIAG